MAEEDEARFTVKKSGYRRTNQWRDRRTDQKYVGLQNDFTYEDVPVEVVRFARRFADAGECWVGLG